MTEPWQNPDWVTVSFRFPRDEKRQLEQIADDLLTTPSRLTREVMLQFLERRTNDRREVRKFLLA